MEIVSNVQHTINQMEENVLKLYAHQTQFLQQIFNVKDALVILEFQLINQPVNQSIAHQETTFSVMVIANLALISKLFHLMENHAHSQNVSQIRST